MSLPVVRTSERKSFRRCPQQWYWSYRMGLTPRHTDFDARWFGIGIHIALATWYKKGKRRGPHPADTFEKWCGEEIAYIRTAPAGNEWEADEEKFWDARELGTSMLVAYVDTYGKDDSWRVLATEQPFKVKVSNGGKPVATFASTFDGVYFDEEDGQVYLMEHKTAAQINTAYLSLDDQGGTYFAVASRICQAKGWLPEGKRIAGITYNFLRKSKPDSRPRDAGGRYLNQDGSVSKRQPPAAFAREIIERKPAEVLSQMQRLADEVEVMNAIRRGDIPLTKNSTRECTWCDFFQMCQLHERGDDWAEYARAGYTQRDPYEHIDKSASND